MRYWRVGIVTGFSLWCGLLIAGMYVNFRAMREPFCPEFIPTGHFFVVLSISTILPYLFLFVMNGMERKKKTKQFQVITKLYLSTLFLFILGCVADYII